MYVVCHKCQGEGYVLKEIIRERRVLCITCWGTHNSVLRGQIWVEDCYDPLTPPSSPR